MGPRTTAVLARPVVGALLTVAVFLFGFGSSVATGWARWACVAGAAVATVALFFANRAAQAESAARVESSEAVAEDVRRRTHVAVGSALTPLLRLVAQVHEEPSRRERHALRRAAVPAVLAAVAASIGPDDLTRACYFALDLDPSGVALGLRFRAASGRTDEPHTVFDIATPAGRGALAMVLDDRTVFCHDTATDPPPGWDDHPHRYRTFIAVPVRADREVFGMLTVDCPEPGDLVQARDEPLVVVFARVLAATQARRAPDPDADDADPWGDRDTDADADPDDTDTDVVGSRGPRPGGSP